MTPTVTSRAQHGEVIGPAFPNARSQRLKMVVSKVAMSLGMKLAEAARRMPQETRPLL
jgi:hypothetical protein